MTTFYPLKFYPILKEKLWGGEKLTKYLKKDSISKHIGESWELSTVSDNISVVSNGPLKGQTLKSIIERSPEEVLGTKNFRRFGSDFPLLIKFIDANKDLSIQLHPDDELAKVRHDSFGKTEMWYVLQADSDANLIVGFTTEMDRKTYLGHLEDKTLPEILNYEKVRRGDAFFIEAGRIHAIGAGVLLAEIQQKSDITYRVYDWDRVDHNGQTRELHNELAIDAFKFNLKNDYRISYDTLKNRSNQMVSSPFFTTSYIEVKDTIEKTNSYGSFLIYICVDGTCSITANDYQESLSMGETILLPAAIDTFTLTGSEAILLEVRI